MYNWQHPQWPHFDFDGALVNPGIEHYGAAVKSLEKKIRELPQQEVTAFILERMVEEASTTSGIEGEVLSKEELMSSLRNNLNIGTVHEPVRDRRAKSIAELIVLNRSTFQLPLSEITLKYWHETLLNWDTRLNNIGRYRSSDAPMQIISGPSYRLTVHFEAPPASQLREEMGSFIDYCSVRSTYSHEEAILKAGIAHIWFESIHPFEDGNGRIGRAIIEKFLSQGLGDFIPFSISHAIERRCKEYYESLKQSQTSPDITAWMAFFVECLNEAVNYADTLVSFTVQKHAYFKKFDGLLSTPQIKAIGKMFLAGPKGFRGGMTAKKYMSITRASRATASRSLTELAGIGALEKKGAGRSVHYRLMLE